MKRSRSRWTTVAGSQGEILRWERTFQVGSIAPTVAVFTRWEEGSACTYWWRCIGTKGAVTNIRDRRLRGPYLTHGAAKRAATAAMKGRGKR